MLPFIEDVSLKSFDLSHSRAKGVLEATTAVERVYRGNWQSAAQTAAVYQHLLHQQQQQQQQVQQRLALEDPTSSDSYRLLHSSGGEGGRSTTRGSPSAFLSIAAAHNSYNNNNNSAVPEISLGNAPTSRAAAAATSPLMQMSPSHAGSSFGGAGYSSPPPPQSQKIVIVPLPPLRSIRSLRLTLNTVRANAATILGSHLASLRHLESLYVSDWPTEIAMQPDIFSNKLKLRVLSVQRCPLQDDAISDLCSSILGAFGTMTTGGGGGGLGALNSPLSRQSSSYSTALRTPTNQSMFQQIQELNIVDNCQMLLVARN